MEEFIKRLQDPKVLTEGEIRSYSEAGALLIKRMIEVDLPNNDYFPQGVDPYKWLAPVIDKSERTLRAWSYDWNSPSGKKPTILDFFNLIMIIGGSRAIGLFKMLGSGISADQQREQYKDVITSVADHIKDLSDRLYDLSNQYEKKED